MRRSVYLLFISALLLACSSCRNTQNGGDAAADSLQAEVGSLAGDEKGPSVNLDAPMVLVYRFTKGDTFGYKISKVENVTMMQDTVSEKKEQILTHWYTFSVIEGYPDGGGRLRAECDRVSFSHKYDGPQGKKDMNYDSRASNSHDIEKLYSNYNATVKTPFEIVVAADGRIAAVEKLDAVIRNYLKDDFATTKSNQIESIKQDYAQSGIKAVLQMIFQNLPDTPVGKDSSWVIMKPEQMGYLNYRNDAAYALSDVTKTAAGRLAHISARISSTFTGNRTMDTGQGMATMEDFNVKGTGRTTYNIDKGRVHRRKIKNTVYVKMYIEPPAELKQLTKIENFWWSNSATVEDSIEPYTR